MPPIKPREIIIIFRGNRIAMESPVMRVFQLDIVQTLIGIDMAVTDDLDLWLVRDGLEIGM